LKTLLRFGYTHSTYLHPFIDSAIQTIQIGNPAHTKGFPNLWEINCAEFSQSAHLVNLAKSVGSSAIRGSQITDHSLRRQMGTCRFNCPTTCLVMGVGSCRLDILLTAIRVGQQKKLKIKIKILHITRRQFKITHWLVAHLRGLSLL